MSISFIKTTNVFTKVLCERNLNLITIVIRVFHSNYIFYFNIFHPCDFFKSIFGFFEMNADEQFIMLEHLGHLRDLEDVFAILTIPIGGKKEIAND